MNHGRRFFVFIALCIVLGGGLGYSRQPHSNDPPAAGIGQSLKTRGYVTIPLRRYQNTDFIYVEAKIGGVLQNLLVDTGASSTVLDAERSKKVGLKWKQTSDVPVNLLSVDTPSMVSPCDGIVFGLHQSRALQLWTLDLSAVKAALRERGETSFDGVLGADFLRMHTAIVDYESMTLFVRDMKPAK